MANKVEIVVVARNDTGGFRSITDGIKKAVDDAGRSAPKSGEDFALGFMNRFRTIVTPQGAAALAAVAIAAAPAIGATIAGAVIGGGAGLGILGGLMLVKDNPRIAQIGESVGKTIESNMKIDAGVFVEPVLAGIGIIDSAFDDSRSNFQRIFAAASEFVEPLAATIRNVINDLSSGLATMIEGSGPTVGAFLDGIASSASIVGEWFRQLGEDGAAAGTAITAVFQVVNVSLMAIFGTISSLTDAFGFLAQMGMFGPVLQEHFLVAKAAAEEAKGSIDEFASSVNAVNDAATNTKNGLQALSDQLRAQYDPAFALVDAQNALAKAQGEYEKAVTDAGAESWKAQEKLTALGKAGVNVATATANASGVFDGKMSPALRGTLTAAGATAGQIDALERQFREAKAAGDAFAHGYYADAYVTYHIIGKPDRRGNFGNLGDFSGVGGYAHGGITGAAGGGMRSGMKMVGEFGPELIQLPPSTRVHSNSDTRRMMASGKGGGGNMSITINSGGSRMDDLLVEILSDAVRQRGGNVQTVLGKG